jgi:hypothetical protein
MDSPEHLAELEPLYAIRPLYIQVTSLVNRTGLSPQAAINLVAAVSLLLCALAVGVATQRYFCSILLVASPGILTCGRLGTPDAFSAFAVVVGCIAIIKKQMFVAILFLMLSVWIRTDNVLFVGAIFGWLVWNKQLRASHGLVLGGLAIASVEWINILSGNYGWAVLFHYSFIGGKYPAEITPHITLAKYIRVLIENAMSLGPQLAPWLLLGIGAWRLKSPQRQFLAPVALACVLHYLLFPSAEARYFVWAYLLTGIIFIRALMNPDASYRVAFDVAA